ncbi:hypothetical protein H8E77_10595 [bacterium]|nr:hypothetical protein [bacterium]
MYVVKEKEIKKAISELSSFRMDESGTEILWLTECGPKVVGEIGKFGIDLTPGVQQLLDWNSQRDLKKLDEFLRNKRIIVVRDAGSCSDGA